MPRGRWRRRRLACHCHADEQPKQWRYAGAILIGIRERHPSLFTLVALAHQNLPDPLLMGF